MLLGSSFTDSSSTFCSLLLALAGLASALGCAHARARWWPTRHLSPFACAARFASHLFRYGIPLEIVSYKELYGWSMDEIVKAVKENPEAVKFTTQLILSWVKINRFGC